MAAAPPRQRASREAEGTDAYRKAAKRLGARIRQLREERRMTIEDAAEAMKIDPKYLQKIELNMTKFNVTLVTLVRIAQGLNTSLAGLFEGGPVLRSTSQKTGVRKRRRVGR